jgi:uncharacterized protein
MSLAARMNRRSKLIHNKLVMIYLRNLFWRFSACRHSPCPRDDAAALFTPSDNTRPSSLFARSHLILALALGLMLVALLGSPTGLVAQVAASPVAGSAQSITPAEIFGYWGLDKTRIDEAIARLEHEAGTDSSKLLRVKSYKMEMSTMPKHYLLILQDGKVVEFDRFKLRTMPTQLTGINGHTFTLQTGQHLQQFALEGGNLVNQTGLVDPDHLGPVFILRKLNPEEIKSWNDRLARMTSAPSARADLSTRLEFLTWCATPEQADAMLKTQPDLLTSKTNTSENALTFALQAEGMVTELNVHRVEQILDAGFDIKSPPPRGCIPVLQHLVRNSPDLHLDAIKLLAKRGADVKETDADGRNLLMLYCEQGQNTEFLQWLIDQGIPVNAMQKNKATALYAALEAKWADGARALLDAGADLALVPDAVRTAAWNFDLPSIRLLFERGIKQTDGMAAVAIAIGRMECEKNSDAEALQRLATQRAVILTLIAMDKSAALATAPDDESPLSLTSDMEIAKTLIALGADLNVEPGPNGHFPLFRAAQKSLALTKYYVEKGANVNAAGLHGDIIGAAVSVDGNLATVEYLIKNGAKLNRPDRTEPIEPNCFASAILAKGKDSALYVDYLLAHGADPNVQAIKTIDACVRAKNPALLRRLVSAGMRLDGDYSKSYRSPLDIAVINRNPEMVKLMLELGAEPFAPLSNGRSVVDMVKSPSFSEPNTPEAKSIIDLLTSLTPPAALPTPKAATPAPGSAPKKPSNSAASKIIPSTPPVAADDVSKLPTEGGFENESDRWVDQNKGNNFHRVPSGSLVDCAAAPALGAFVLKIDKWVSTDTNYHGPQYLTQVITFAEKPAKVRVSADVMFDGPKKTKRDIRLAVTDPSIKYTGDKSISFPFVWKPIPQPLQWYHLEWDADLSSLSNQTLKFGFMFSHKEGVCYLDNVKFTPQLPKADTQQKHTPSR